MVSHFIGVCFHPYCLPLGFEGQGLGVIQRGRGRGRGKTEKWDSPFIFVRNVRSHFQMEIDILEISLDIWIFGTLGVNLPMFLVSLSMYFKSKPCDDLRLAAAGSFGLVVR